MTQIKLMYAKLHRVTVTEANVNYVGSITIDQNLMDQVGILPLEEVDVINLANGKRWSTYAIAGKAGTGEICPNGGAALLCEPGNLLIIIAYEYRDRVEVRALFECVLRTAAVRLTQGQHGIGVPFVSARLIGLEDPAPRRWCRPGKDAVGLSRAIAGRDLPRHALEVDIETGRRRWRRRIDDGRKRRKARPAGRRCWRWIPWR